MNKRKTARQTFFKPQIPSFRHAGTKPFDFQRARNCFAGHLLYKKLVNTDDKPILDLNIEINPQFIGSKRRLSQYKTVDYITIDRWKQKYSTSPEKQKSPRKLNIASVQHLPVIKQLSKQPKNNTDDWYNILMKKRSQSVKDLNNMLSTKKLSSQQLILQHKRQKKKLMRNTLGAFKQRYGLQHNLSQKLKLVKTKKGKTSQLLQINQNPERWDVISQIQQNQIHIQDRF